MIYVYILQSVQQPERYYAGVTADLRSRLRRHNAGEVPHTSKYAPWTVKTYIAFLPKSRRTASRRTSSRRRVEPSRKSGFEREHPVGPPFLPPNQAPGRPP